MNDSPETTGRTTTRPKCTKYTLGLVLAILLLAVPTLELGCRRSSSSPIAGGPSDPEAARVQQREMFTHAMRMFFDYDQYDSPEWLQQAIGRLDHWVRDQKPLADWQPDPMAKTLPRPLSELPEVVALDRLEFSNPDAYAFWEAVWLQDVSGWARGDAVDELDQARELFDWTVRNIQLLPDSTTERLPGPGRILQQPWETLLMGRGTAADRAWLFVLLARQQGIDAAVIALNDRDDPAAQRDRLWVAVLSQGELYLFDPALGLPIPAPDGLKRDAAGQLDIRPATLAQVAGDDALLRQLDVDEYRYPVQADQVQSVVALLEASPTYLSQRMEIVERQLAGGERLILTARPSAQAERFQACPHVAAVRLWELPYQTIHQERALGTDRLQWRAFQFAPFSLQFDTSPDVRRRSSEITNMWGWWSVAAREQALELQRNAEKAEQSQPAREQTWEPALWKARLLHFKGKLTGEQGATYYYTRARVPNREIESAQIDPNLKLVLAWAKTSASYWLGLIAAEQHDEQRNREVAIDWLATRTLEAEPNGPWAPGARYNLGRVYEADGQIAKAVQMYRGDTGSPARHGNLLRARWLQPPETPEPAEKPAPKEPSNEQAAQSGERPAVKSAEASAAGPPAAAAPSGSAESAKGDSAEP